MIFFPGKTKVCLVLTGVVPALLWLSLSGCGIKRDRLPVLEFPYVAEIQFFKEVENVGGKARKKRFKRDRITSPFYFFLKIKEIENSGVATVAFYSPKTGESPSSETNSQGKPNTPAVPPSTEYVKTVEKHFNFGKEGGYYEYIIFFDKIEGLVPGTHRYAIFMNRSLIYEGKVTVNTSI